MSDPELVNGATLIYNPDGTVKAKINEITINGVVHELNDDLNGDFGSGRGLKIAPNGNVYTSHYNALVIWDYKTMEPLDFILPNGDRSISSAAVDEEGNILITNVACNANGVRFFMEGGLFIGMAIDALHPNLPGYSRDLEITPDGKNLYIANVAGMLPEQPSIGHWYSDAGAWGVYEFKGLIGEYESTCEDIYLDNKQNRLWIGVNSGPGTDPTPSRYDCWDLNTMQIVDVINSPDWSTFNSGVSEANFENGVFSTPRGIAFSNDGTKAYIVCFNTGLLEYKLKGTTNVNEPKAIPETFTLSQNYPNPFNPSTNFSYSVPSNSDVKIAVYDLFGREIKTLVNEAKAAGEYSVTWNGRDNNNKQVATGVYFYNMKAGNFTKTMKMMLMK
jgi:DNA-binding beta-propeller fold protein YncE